MNDIKITPEVLQEQKKNNHLKVVEKDKIKVVKMRTPEDKALISMIAEAFAKKVLS